MARASNQIDKSSVTTLGICPAEHCEWRQVSTNEALVRLNLYLHMLHVHGNEREGRLRGTQYRWLTRNGLMPEGLVAA